jgi:nucleoid DNA-binding protein
MRLKASNKKPEPVIEEISEATGLTQLKVREVVTLFLSKLRDEVWSEKRVVLPDFGVFTVRRRKARAINAPPGTSGPHYLPRHQVVGFRASKNWRKR